MPVAKLVAKLFAFVGSRLSEASGKEHAFDLLVLTMLRPSCSFFCSSVLKSPSPSAPHGRKAHAFGLAHWNNVALEVTIGSRPTALIYHELPETMVSSPLVGLGYNPSWSVTHAEIQDLTLIREGVEGLHDFRP